MNETVPYSKLIIAQQEKSRWTKGEFLRDRSSLVGLEVKEETTVLLPDVSRESYVSQTNKTSFTEFEAPGAERENGYTAEDMRKNGCGISSLFMILSTLGTPRFRQNFKTVGELATESLSLHRNDLTSENQIIKVGTPVFNLKSGWYHDALLYAASSFADVLGYRYVDINLEEVGAECARRAGQGERVLCILSFTTIPWLKNDSHSAVSTHLFVCNGFMFENSKVSAVRVVDPYPHDGKPKLNEWVEITPDRKEAFTGRVMFFLAKTLK